MQLKVMLTDGRKMAEPGFSSTRLTLEFTESLLNQPIAVPPESGPKESEVIMYPFMVTQDSACRGLH
jgi:hypothetical protein